MLGMSTSAVVVADAKGIVRVGIGSNTIYRQDEEEMRLKECESKCYVKTAW